jgi:hypothetical protein
MGSSALPGGVYGAGGGGGGGHTGKVIGAKPGISMTCAGGASGVGAGIASGGGPGGGPRVAVAVELGVAVVDGTSRGCVGTGLGVFAVGTGFGVPTAVGCVSRRSLGALGRGSGLLGGAWRGWPLTDSPPLALPASVAQP